jgi:DNA-binding transcriptional MerR regulator
MCVMTDSLDITEVAHRTGLTSRALRFYEARGLVQPLRSYNGRRHYGPAELERIHQIVMLKRAGLSLSDIARMTASRSVDLSALISAKLAAIEEQAAALDEARLLLTSIKSRIDRSEPIDVATFCSLIQQRDIVMTDANSAWAAITDRYMTDEAKADFAKAMPLLGEDFASKDQDRRWQELGARIKAALPLDPTSDAALAFVREWFALLAPFSAVATPAMWDGSRAMYADVDNWQGKTAADPGFDGEVWRFINAATSAAMQAGKTINGLPKWFLSKGEGEAE